MIYLVKAEGTNLYKIGYTGGKVRNRVKSMQTGCPHKLSVIKKVEGSKYREKLLHEAFSSKQRQGEWFEFNDENLEEVSIRMTTIKDCEFNFTEAEDCKQRVASLSFRTPKETMQYLRFLAESDDRSVSYVLSKMIDYFRSKGIRDIRKINTNPRTPYI